jgi:hypothetical protein
MPDLLAARSQMAIVAGVPHPLRDGGRGHALVAGGLVLFPSLIYLLRVFKREPTRS